MYGDFFLLERQGDPLARAERLAFGETSGRDEAWLRDTLFAHPEILPIRDIDASYGPLVPLCTELRCPAGPIDISFIDQFGRLTLVECKLWRNPEARRKVVAQILDYARAISRWSYSDLQRQVSAATGRTGNVPFELVAGVTPGLREQAFVDAATTALRAGRFLLLIAGDGIREDVGALAELVNRNAATGYTLGLVEVALYGLPDDGLVIQPRVLAKSAMLERTFVLVRDEAGVRAVSADEPPPDFVPVSTGPEPAGERTRQEEYRDWWAPVLQMRFDDPDQEPPKLYWPNNVRVFLPYPNTWVLGYRNMSSNSIGVCLVQGGPRHEVLHQLGPEYEQLMAQLPVGTTVRQNKETGSLFPSSRRSLSEFASADDQRRWVSEALNQYVNVFRPRLKALTAS